MREFIKQMFVVLVLMLYFCRPLTRKCVSINNQRCMVRPMFIDLNLDELHYYQFIINMNRCKGSCNIAEDPFSSICVPNKIEDMNQKVFNMIKGINESKILAEHISCEFRCEFDGRKCNSRQKWNNDNCHCECKKLIKHGSVKN